MDKRVISDPPSLRLGPPEILARSILGSHPPLAVGGLPQHHPAHRSAGSPTAATHSLSPPAPAVRTIGTPGPSPHLRRSCYGFPSRYCGVPHTHVSVGTPP